VEDSPADLKPLDVVSFYIIGSICGREFGTASLEIHQKTCIKKYANDLTNMEVAHRVNMPSSIDSQYIQAKQVMQKL